MRSLKTEERRIFHIGDYVAVERRPGVFKVRGNNREFTLRQIDPRRWKANGKSSNGSHKSHYPRLTIQAEVLADAVAEVESKLFPQMTPNAGANLELAEVFARWIRTKTVSEHTEAVYKDGVKRFLEWAQARGHKYWSELTRGVLQEYLAAQKKYRSITGRISGSRFAALPCGRLLNGRTPFAISALGFRSPMAVLNIRTTRFRFLFLK